MILTANMFSNALLTNVTITAVIPTPEGNEQIINDDVKKKYGYDQGLPVVYLLHGAFGNCHSWTRFSNVERYAQKYGCILIMPSVENSFYHDMNHGGSYYTYVSKELPELVKSIFPVSRKREDTYIAGFSMGGYGSWYIALNNPGSYIKAASMSGALDLPELYKMNMSGADNHPIKWNDILKEPEKLKGSDSDLMHLYDKCAAEGVIPALYQCCGTEDSLYPLNVKIKNELNERNACLTYNESEGGHTWDYWDKNIQNVLKWMFEK